MADDSNLRIGELSRRSGVSPELLRAWERRYGLLRPARSPGGLRLYSSGDLERVRRMQDHMSQGLAAREAAALASRAEVAGERAATFDPQSARAALAGVMDVFDEPGAQSVIDDLLAMTTVDTLLSEVLVPYLHELGERWESGEMSVAQEHFASNVLRGRLLGLARGWGRGTGRRALLACPAGERHDLGLIAFGLALRARGWRIDYLGGDTPAESIAEAADAVEPALLVLAAVAPDRLWPLDAVLAGAARRHRLALAGAGAQGLEPGGDVLVLIGDPVAEAERVSALVPA